MEQRTDSGRDSTAPSLSFHYCCYTVLPCQDNTIHWEPYLGYRLHPLSTCTITTDQPVDMVSIPKRHILESRVIVARQTTTHSLTHTGKRTGYKCVFTGFPVPILLDHYQNQNSLFGRDESGTHFHSRLCKKARCPFLRQF